MQYSLVWLALIGGLLFGAAGRLDVPAFWEYLAVGVLVTLVATVLLDPDLMRERLSPGGRSLDWRYALLVIPLGIHWALAGLDAGRYHWSPAVSPPVQLVAVIGVSIAFGIILWAMYVNPFFSSIIRIQRERGHKVVTAGPYRWVRHPGYTAALVACLCSGIALGSWLAVVPALILIPPVLVRTLREDRVLTRELPGYDGYAQRVRYRLVPGIW